MALVGVELKTLVSEPDALTTRPPPRVSSCICLYNVMRALTVTQSEEKNKRNKACDNFTLYSTSIFFIFLVFSII